MTAAQSILSHEERAVARRLREGDDVATIAADRDVSEASVERAVERVRTKTTRALATLQQSPFTEEVVEALPPEDREALAERL